MNYLRKKISNKKCFFCEAKVGNKYTTAPSTSLNYCDKKCMNFSTKRCSGCNTVLCFGNIDNSTIEKTQKDYISINNSSYVVTNYGVMDKIEYYCSKTCIDKVNN